MQIQETSQSSCFQTSTSAAQSKTSGTSTFDAEMYKVRYMLELDKSPTGGWSIGGRNTRTFTEAKLSDGTAVSVSKLGDVEGESCYRLRLGEGTGKELELEFSGDLRVGTDLEGKYLVYSPQTHTTRTYAADGSITETEGDATQESAQVIHIGVTGATLQGGDGDDVFLVLGANTVVDCGAGNDTVVLGYNASRADIRLGEGNNQVSGQMLHSGSIKGGDGDNQIRLAMHDTSVVLGNGINTLSCTTIDGEVSLGNGDNCLNLAVSGTRIVCGDGNNMLQGTTIEGAANISFGNGNNSLDVHEIREDSRVSFGDGNNTINLYSLGQLWTDFDGWSSGTPGAILAQSGASLSMGNGNNSIEIYEILEHSSLTTGHGDSTIVVHTLANSSLHVGNGNNDINISGIETSTTQVGNGNNTVHYGSLDESTAVIGNGNNTITVGTIGQDSSLNVGDGNNAFELWKAAGNARISLGDGDNDLRIWDFLGTASFSIGNGNNILTIQQLMDEAVFSLGSGNSVVYLAEKSDTATLSLGGGENTVRNLAEMGLDFFDPAREDKNPYAEELAALRLARMENGLPSMYDPSDPFQSSSFGLRSDKLQVVGAQSELNERIALLTHRNFTQAAS